MDYETFGTRSLPKVGLNNYVKDEAFTPLIACVWSATYKRVFDFVRDPECMEDFQALMAKALTISAHNSQFEERVSERFSAFDTRTSSTDFLFEDTAVLAAAAGASRHLAGAAPQLLGVDKMAEGQQLIRLFSLPNETFDHVAPTWERIQSEGLEAEWDTFIDYCMLDAQLSYELSCTYGIPPQENQARKVTEEMNRAGWTVDVRSLEQMQKLYQKNLEQLLASFRRDFDPEGELNLNSLKQLKEWCRERGVRAVSFDEKHVAKMIQQLYKRLSNINLTVEKVLRYEQVLNMLLTKQALGGSALKKLEVIAATVDPDDHKLRDQYLHIGAPQSYRTTGRGVQMQNLPRLAHLRNMDELFTAPDTWTNEELAGNIRQLFCSAHPDGKLIVGDFSSVESRGAAWLAGEQWKLDAYHQGKDLYKVLASSPDMFNKPYESITKVERQSGKVGELSCGYGAGPRAVAEFAENMGIEMSLENAAHIVTSWRAANPHITAMWYGLDDCLKQLSAGYTRIEWSSKNASVKFSLNRAPESLQELHAGAKTLRVSLWVPPKNAHSEPPVLTREFHGFHQQGKDFVYYKPSELKTGDLWKKWFVNPKTGQRENYKLYGGKLTGILTQSFCREIFFSRAIALREAIQPYDNVTLIGQFHDELVMDWVPGSLEGNSIMDPNDAVDLMHRAMTDPYVHGNYLDGFPLDAEINYDYRYIK